ncbi:MAG: PQQ-binding-like beta-propeller repeat protein [Candidatus Bathyarchaeota archaeon]|nr:PQQ-binding-like beta-propeller repeat protein [Candidatus Bathyarchaeum tardum]WGM88584.1 MAG: PQQ-binding-like beta-propeller repeat protein [Candidatus Bathyarchaeum tardum]
MTKIKQKITTIMLTMLLLLSTIILTISTGAAQEIREKTTYAYIGAIPNPVGVNQPVLLHVGISDYLAVTSHGWEGLTITVTKPDGQSETLGPFKTDSTGGTGTVFTPNMVGTYTFQTHFPEQLYTWNSPPAFSQNIYGTIRYLASDSEILEVEVQQEPGEYYPVIPTPNEYWTRPIDAQHRSWNTISASWLGTPANNFAPFNEDAPESAHILWEKPLLKMGGLAGGFLGEAAFECGDAYEGFFSDSIILAGVLVYNQYKAGFPTQKVVAVDIHTGEELWNKELQNLDGKALRVSFGQTFYFSSHNYHGTYGYIWALDGNDWHAFDPLSGEWVYTMLNVPSRSVRFGASYTLTGPKGEIYIYETNIQNGWMALWNSSRAVTGPATEFGAGSWRAEGQIIENARQRGQEWNITIPTGLPGGISATLSDRIIGTTAAGWIDMGDAPIQMWSLSLEPGNEGKLLWQTSWQPPLGDLTVSYGTGSSEAGIFTLRGKESRQVWGFSTETGEQLWGPTESMHYLGIFGIGSAIVYDKLFVNAKMAGELNAYDIDTGNLIWSYEAVDPYNEMLWGNNWPVYPLFITDGKIYLGHSEHSPVDPKPRGAPFICIDAETGQEIWRADGLFRQTDWGGKAIIGDSIIATYDSYDQMVYAIGKGPSAISISAPNTAIQLGSSALITGTVTDVSPGTNSIEMKARFPDGVPAISDEYMSEWMMYVYKQFERPADATGVPVKIEIVDPNNQYAWIGTATTDVYGNYGYSFRPQVEGEYMIIATFEGTNAYYGSAKTTYLVVDPAPTPQTPIEPEQPTPTEPEVPIDLTEPVETPLITTELAIIIASVAIAVIGVASYWLLRRK